MGDGLGSLFRQEQNPYDRRIKTTASVMGNSGFARPFLAYAMGRDTASAKEWDDSRNAKADEMIEGSMRAAKDTQDREYAQKILQQVVEISKHDAPAATQILDRESADNPYLSKFKGIKFSAETTKDNWATVTAGDGQAYQVFLPGLGAKNEDGTAMSNEQLIQQGILRPVGAPKREANKLEYEEGPDKVTEITRPDGTRETKRSPKWNPKGGDGSGGGPNTVYLEGPNGDLKAMDKKDIPSLQQKLDAGYKPYKDSDVKILEEMINLKLLPELNKEREKAGLAPRELKKQGAAAPAPAGNTATLSGNNVVVNGNTYPLNQDGTVTIGNKKYKVNR